MYCICIAHKFFLQLAQQKFVKSFAMVRMFSKTSPNAMNRPAAAVAVASQESALQSSPPPQDKPQGYVQSPSAEEIVAAMRCILDD